MPPKPATPVKKPELRKAKAHPKPLPQVRAEVVATKPAIAKTAAKELALQVNVIQQLAGPSSPDSTLNLNVTLDVVKLFNFIYEMLAPAIRSRFRDSNHYDNCIAAAIYLAQNVLNYPLVGRYPRWYMDLCHSARTKTVDGQTYIFNLNGVIQNSTLTPYYNGNPAVQDGTTNGQYAIASILMPTIGGIFNTTSCLEWLAQFDRDLLLIDVVKYKPRHPNCVSAACYTYNADPALYGQWSTIALEVPIVTPWIGALALAVAPSARCPQYRIARCTNSFGTIAYLLRNRLVDYVSKCTIKAYDPQEVTQRLIQIVNASSITTSDTVLSQCANALYYGLCYKLQPFFGIGVGLEFRKAGTPNYVRPFSNAPWTIPGPDVGSVLVPEAILSFMQGCSPHIFGNQLYLPCFVSVGPDGGLVGGAFAMHFGTVYNGTNWITGLNTNSTSRNVYLARTTILSAVAKVKPISCFEVDYKKTTLGSTVLYNASGGSTQFASKSAHEDVDKHRIYSWTPFAVVDSSILHQTIHKEKNTYMIPINLDMMTLATRFGDSVAGYDSSSAANIDVDSDVDVVEQFESTLAPLIAKARLVKYSQPNWATSLVHRLIPRHGDYGGPSWTGGVWDGTDYSRKAVDMFDAYYKEHDLKVHIANGDNKAIWDADKLLAERLTSSVTLRSHPYHHAAKALFLLRSLPRNAHVVEEKDEL